MSDTMVGIVIAAGIALLILMTAVRIVKEYERGVIFRLGRIIGAKGPGLFFIIPDRPDHFAVHPHRSTWTSSWSNATRSTSGCNRSSTMSPTRGA